MNEDMMGMDGIAIGASSDPVHEGGKIRTAWFIEKWSQEAVDFSRKWQESKGFRRPIVSELLRVICPVPDEGELAIDGNMLLNEGIGEMLDLIIGAGGSVVAYNAANAQIGVGDTQTAEANTQTDLQAPSNKLYKAMNAGFPSRSAQTLSFQSDFTTGEANWHWQEASIRNGVSRDRNMNRKVVDMGTKASGLWTVTGTLTLA